MTYVERGYLVLVLDFGEKFSYFPLTCSIVFILR